jgi:hypothetical protein
MQDCPPLLVAQAFAIDATNVAWGLLGVTLDFSLESLRDFDELLESYRPHYSGITRQMASEVQFPFPAEMWGSYVGEVLRRKWGGEWVPAALGPHAELVVKGRRVSPITVIARWFESSGAVSVSQFVQEIEAAL